jgi:hypothetical protein
MSWRPSTANGWRRMEPLPGSEYVPCCHCIMPCGQEGVVASEVSDAKRTVDGSCWLRTIRDCLVDCLFIVAVNCERIRDARQWRLNQAICDRVVEALAITSVPSQKKQRLSQSVSATVDSPVLSRPFSISLTTSQRVPDRIARRLLSSSREPKRRTTQAKST